MSHSDGYYIGVFMALGCSLSGALKSIIIKYVSKDFDTVALMFYMGFGGVFTIFAIASVDMGVNHLVEQLQMADAERCRVIELRRHKSFATIKFRRLANTGCLVCKLASNKIGSGHCKTSHSISALQRIIEPFQKETDWLQCL